jgi:hypothetical protein
MIRKCGSCIGSETAEVNAHPDMDISSQIFDDSSVDVGSVR